MHRFLFGRISPLLGLAAIALIGSCDKDADALSSENKTTVQGYNVREASAPTTADDATLPVAESNGRTNALVLKFTGQGCPACPAMTRYLDRQQQENDEVKDNLYVVAFHPWYNFSPDLYSVDAKQYAAHYQIPGLPTAVVNGDVLSYYPNLTDWTQAAPLITSGVRTERTAHDAAKVSFRAKALENATVEHPLAVIFWLVEKKVVCKQYDGSWKTDYEHHNVLRAVLNGYEGQDYQLGETLAVEVSLRKKAEEKYQREVDLDNCEIFAVVLDKTTKKYIDVAKCDLEKMATGIKNITLTR